MKKLLFTFLMVCVPLLYSEQILKVDDDSIVEKIYEVLVKEYDNYKDKSFEEKLVLKLGKKTFIKSINIWKDNYKNLNDIKIILDYHLENMALIVQKNSDEEKAKRFRELLENLTKLGYKNMQLYFYAVKDSLFAQNVGVNEINVVFIDDALCNKKYFEMKKTLYDEERKTKKEILEIMNDKKLKYKMAFYIFAFNFLNNIREKIITRDLERMEQKIKV
jgi:hypothetical protein